MTRDVVALVAMAALWPVTASGQAFVPPPDVRAAGPVQLAGDDKACRAIPLWFGASEDDVKKFYAKASGIAPMEQAKFIGWKNQKSVSVDWITAFAAPFRGTAGTTISDTTSGEAGSESTVTTGDTLMARFAQGGDLYATVSFPLFACTPAAMSAGAPVSRFYVLALPRVGMVTPALGTNVPTEVEEANFDAGVEIYADWGTPGLKGFIQLRLARQFVTERFAQTLRLENGNAFALHQFSAGVQLGFLRISWYKLLAAPDAPFEEFKKGKLLLQLVPYMVGG